MSLKLVPFKSLGMVFYSPSIVTMAVPVTVVLLIACFFYYHIVFMVK